MNPTGYDYFDFGCSTGANIKYMQDVVPNSRGLGIDIDQRKIKLCRSNGFDAIQCDILKLGQKKMVSFVTMSHFLEHLPNVNLAEAMIRKGIDVAKDFVFIRQPWFDSDGFLLLNDLKFYWSDWRGHSNKMTSLDFYLILKKAFDQKLISGFNIYARLPVAASSDKTIIPLDSPIDQHYYDFGLHGLKNQNISIFPTAYKEIVVTASVNPVAEIEPFLLPLEKLTLLKKVGVSL
ncbi:MAG: class I SAM-dependent methyltransferase [Pseudomonadota bacterium]